VNTQHLTTTRFPWRCRIAARGLSIILPRMATEQKTTESYLAPPTPAPCIIREPFMAAMYGKWAQPGVPKKGWTCERMQDLGSPQATCEMCETKTIRYVHTMTHPHYGTALQVGCVCAQKMQNDYAGPRLREKKLRSIADRRKRWLRRRGWTIFAQRNAYINTDGFLVLILWYGDGNWGVRIAERNTGRLIWEKERYNTADAAKLAAFDQMIILKTARAEAVPAVPIETGIVDAWSKLVPGRDTARAQAPR
jgi:hypothetical protein